MHLSVLSSKQVKLLKELKFLKRYEFYLAGGTALALQISHLSLDFDFYTPKNFNSQKLIEQFKKKFKTTKEIYIAKDTLLLRVEKVRISFFKYPFDLVRPLIKFQQIKLASLEDISAMKMIAISQRGTKRDFFDIYFLIKRFGLPKIIEFTRKKYPQFNIYVGLTGLTYFKEAEEEKNEKNSGF
jgi:predicted nucleotidyltransferase component of viral defense system